MTVCNPPEIKQFCENGHKYTFFINFSYNLSQKLLHNTGAFLTPCKKEKKKSVKEDGKYSVYDRRRNEPVDIKVDSEQSSLSNITYFDM